MVNVPVASLNASKTMANMDSEAPAVRLSLSELQGAKASLQMALSALTHIHGAQPSKSSPPSSPFTSETAGNNLISFSSSMSNPMFTSSANPMFTSSANPMFTGSNPTTPTSMGVATLTKSMESALAANGHKAGSRGDLLDLDSDDDLIPNGNDGARKKLDQNGFKMEQNPLASKSDSNPFANPTFVYDNEYARATIEEGHSDDEAPIAPQAPTQMSLNQAHTLLQRALEQIASLEDRVASPPHKKSPRRRRQRARRTSDSSLSSLDLPGTSSRPSPTSEPSSSVSTPQKSDILDTPDFHTTRTYAAHEAFHPLNLDNVDAPGGDDPATGARARSSSQFTNSLALVEALEQENLELKAELNRLSHSQVSDGGMMMSGDEIQPQRTELTAAATQLREQNDRLVREMEALAAENSVLRSRVGKETGVRVEDATRRMSSFSVEDFSAPASDSMLGTWLRRRRQDASHEDWLVAQCTWLM